MQSLTSQTRARTLRERLSTDQKAIPGRCCTGAPGAEGLLIPGGRICSTCALAALLRRRLLSPLELLRRVFSMTNTLTTYEPTLCTDPCLGLASF